MNNFIVLKLKKTISYISLTLLVLYFISFPQNVISAGKESLIVCFNVIIPCLFPFFICSGLIIQSGLAHLFAKYLKGIMQPLFNVNGSGAIAFILGIISGYPLGAVTACRLYQNKLCSKTEAQRLLAFCNNSGPIFILGSVATLYYSTKVGIILYVAHIIGAITTGIIFRFYRYRDKALNSESICETNKKNFTIIFGEVMNDSVNTILLICGSVVFFGVIVSILKYVLKIDGVAMGFVTGLIEITNGVVGINASFTPLAQKILLTAFVLGFAGLSVHFQVFAILSKTDLSAKTYIVGKLLHAIFSFIYVYIILEFIPLDFPTFVGNVNALCYNDLSPVFLLNYTILYISLGIMFASIIVFIGFVQRKINALTSI